MAEIVKIEGDKIMVGVETGKIIKVSKKNLNYDDPEVGDKVKLYKDGEKYIVVKEKTIGDGLVTEEGGVKTINRHLFVWVFSFLLGNLGVDRFMRGQIGAGVCKLLFWWVTLGLWPLIDWIIALVKAYGSGLKGENLRFGTDGEYLN